MNRKTFSPRARGRHEFTDGVCAVCVAVALLLISNRVKYQRAQGNQMFLNLYQYVARYLRVDSKIVLSPMKARVRVFGINRHRGIISFSLAVEGRTDYWSLVLHIDPRVWDPCQYIYNSKHQPWGTN